MRFFLRTPLTFLLIFVISGCSSPLSSLFNSDTFSPETENHSLLERLELDSQSTDAGVEGAETQASLSNESLLTEIDTVQVKTLIESMTFQTLARSGEITQYPCSSCHIEPLAELHSDQGIADSKAHWDIAIDHADRERDDLYHLPQLDNMDTLHTLTNNPSHLITATRYALNVTAGSPKIGLGAHMANAWVDGTPPRVINNCVDCHNPHQPQWDIRWPSVTKLMVQQRVHSGTFGANLNANAGGDPRSHVQAELPSGYPIPRIN